jgi:hypothetical protein
MKKTDCFSLIHLIAILNNICDQKTKVIFWPELEEVLKIADMKNLATLRSEEPKDEVK